MPAAAKGAIDVGGVFADAERGNGFFTKDRDMGDLTHGGKRREQRFGLGCRGIASGSQREVLHSRREGRGAAGAQALQLLVPALEVPDLEVAALPDQHDPLVDARVAAQLG